MLYHSIVIVIALVLFAGREDLDAVAVLLVAVPLPVVVRPFGVPARGQPVLRAQKLFSSPPLDSCPFAYFLAVAPSPSKIGGGTFVALVTSPTIDLPTQ